MFKARLGSARLHPYVYHIPNIFHDISIRYLYIIDIIDFFIDFSLNQLSMADIVSTLIDIRYIDGISTDILDILNLGNMFLKMIR